MAETMDTGDEPSSSPKPITTKEPMDIDSKDTLNEAPPSNGIIDTNPSKQTSDSQPTNNNQSNDAQKDIIITMNGSHNDDDDDENDKNKNNANTEEQSENSNKNDKNIKIRHIQKIGLNESGQLMSGFEDVHDDQMAFSSESDFG